MWNEEQIKYHLQAARKLDQIMQAAFSFIRQNRDNVTEYEVQQLIKQRFITNNLLSDQENPIVAFGRNTSHVHYFCQPDTAAKLLPGDPIMIDIWGKIAKKGAPYADITWMAVNDNNISASLDQNFAAILKSRDSAMREIKRSLAQKLLSGRAVDSSARDTLKDFGVDKFFLHSTGHSLGTTRVHGPRGGIWPRNNHALRRNMGYTIEPGIYLEGKYGLRSEINFFISDSNELVVTTTPQQKMLLL